MSLRYRIFYLIGFTPWDRHPVAGPLKELVEGPRALPKGRVLDLGCGYGRNAVYLAKAGWKVTGVDGIPRALKVAARRVRAAGVEVDLRKGDVTRLEEGGITGPFQLLLDFGCYHGLSDEEQAAYGRSTARVAAPGATLLLMAISPGGSPLRPKGVTRAQVEKGLSAWEIVSAVADTEMERPRGAPPATWYRLRRR